MKFNYQLAYLGREVCWVGRTCHREGPWDPLGPFLEDLEVDRHQALASFVGLDQHPEGLAVVRFHVAQAHQVRQIAEVPFQDHQDPFQDHQDPFQDHQGPFQDHQDPFQDHLEDGHLEVLVPWIQVRFRVAVEDLAAAAQGNQVFVAAAVVLVPGTFGAFVRPFVDSSCPSWTVVVVAAGRCRAVHPRPAPRWGCWSFYWQSSAWRGWCSNPST